MAARSTPTLVDWSQYLTLRLVSALLEPYPPDQSLQTAKAIGAVYARLSRRRTDRARDHIARAYPELGAAETERLAAASIRYMFELFAVDALVMPKIVQEWSWQRHVRFGNLDAGIDVLLRDEPCILITGHVGNWEFLGYVLALIGFRMTALARPLDNPVLSDWLFTARQRTGLRVITKWGAIEEVQRLIEAGGKIAFIADQNAGDDGLFVPFFGRLASSYKSIGLVAMRYRLPIICGMASRVDKRFEYRLNVFDVIHPEQWEATDDPLFHITARYNHAIERMVRDDPTQYLWVHRRWKSRPKFEREGQRMPDRLRRKLESLPWMTDETLRRVCGAGA